MNFEPCCLPTTIGSLPHIDPIEACDLVLRYTPELPAWPQLSRRSPLENMYAQFSQHLPGATVEDGKVTVNYGPDFDSGLEQLYSDYVSGDDSRYLPGPERALGLGTYLDLLRARGSNNIIAIKGQVTGPISLGLQVTDTQMRAILYDELAGDAVGKYLRLVASAEEKALAEIAPRTIVFLDEPYLHAVGSALFSLSRDTVVRQFEEVFSGLRGLKGTHCCGNTDWSIILSTSLDILNFDALDYGETLALYPDEVKEFIGRGGIIAWGIVPNTPELLRSHDANSLAEALLREMHRLQAKGISLDRLVAQSLVTPTCGLSGLSVEDAETALALLAGVSRKIRSRFLGRAE